MKKNYFARWGKVFGPYNDDEVTRLHAEGKMSEFSWLWDERTHAWKALDPAPPALALREESNVAPIAATADRGIGSAIEVVCHNRHEYVSGTLQRMTETGCELLSWHPESYPTFNPQSPVFLSLLEVDSGEVRNIAAQICGVEREGAVWRYQIRWSQRPSFGPETLHQNFS